MNRKIACAMLAMLAAACSGDDGMDSAGGAAGGSASTMGVEQSSGLPQASRIDALSADQRKLLCGWAATLSEPNGTVDCGAGQVSTRMDRSCEPRLLALKTCSVTVKQAELCFQSTRSSPCTLITDDCMPLAECE